MFTDHPPSSVCHSSGDTMGRRTDFLGRQSFLFGFQSAREVLFLPEVSLSISLFFLKHVLMSGCAGSCSIREVLQRSGGLAAFGIFVPCVGFALVAVCRLWSAQASAVA